MNTPADGATRRSLLRTIGAGVVATSVVAGSASAQDEVAQRFEFNGATGGWEGLAPSSIEGTTNPTLELEAGQTYEFHWENGDGAPHNVVIEDADGNTLVESEFVSSQGETQTVTFTAEAGMASYYCAAHPSSMRGDVSVSGGSTATATATPSSGGEVHEVLMGSTDDGDYYFDPIGLHVEPGDTIRWTVDNGSHNVVSYDDRIPEGAEPFESEIISEGTIEMTFSTEGTYDYYCMPHQSLGMVGRFVVGEAGGPAEGSMPEHGDVPESSTIVEQGSVSYEEFASSSGTATAEPTATPEGTPEQVTSAAPDEQDESTEASGPGFGIAGALSAIGAGTLLRAHRNNDE
ncbi:plastocyanin/azurin family copper-binding protein [Halolamina salifodinae]|uniref:Plastocyanin n=1 Tax=Halolamina salifodinae TaxID=1202767 RepID=A0A8T4GTR5_9EURY|nr:plastocyanin/azurin family copper-binding protein [Halolamina salifodinae]MBP1986481.1 plastocyanin [Halolamina salifodinae]